MKTKTYDIMGIAAACLFASCDLDISPDSYIADSYFYQNQTEVNTAVIGCYGGMQAPLEVEWALTELRSDNTRTNSTSSTNDSFLQLLALDLGTTDASNPNLRTYWEATYRNINNCNKVLAENSLLAVEDEAKRRQYKGECLFIRAYHYFNLVRLFGPVFIVTKETSAEEALQMDRRPMDEVYKLITDDLEEAVSCLEGVTYASSDAGRVTPEAARALLARVLLTLGRYGEASGLLEQVMAVKGKTLSVACDKVFDIANEMNAEILFAVRYKAGNLGIGSPFANTFAPQNSGSAVITGSGDGKNYPTDELCAAYTEGDLRKDVTLAESYYDETKSSPVVEVAYCKKFLSEVSVRYDAENDWPVLRMADVLLMYAECLNETNRTGDALPYVNEVRRRAGLASVGAADATALREAIETERRLEFAYENIRWFDLLRWGKAAETVSRHILTNEWSFYEGYTRRIDPIQEYQLLLPIPQSVIDNNPDVITQNPQY